MAKNVFDTLGKNRFFQSDLKKRSFPRNVDSLGNKYGQKRVRFFGQS